MRYFLYISDAKLEMLASQLAEGEQWKSTVVLRGGLGKWFGVERHVEKSYPASEPREAKLERVCKSLRKRETLGTINDPDHDWIEDTFACYVSYPVPSKTGAPVVLFHYQDPPDCNPLQARQQILLAGSAAYLMPRNPAGERIVPLEPGGHWPTLSAALARILDGEDEESVLHESIGGAVPAAQYICGSVHGPYGEFHGQGPIVRVRSLFRVLCRQSIYPDRPDRNVVYLGTPLYVEWTSQA